MALDKFYFKVKKLDVMPDEFVSQHTERYENNTKVIYGVHATAYAEKNETSTERQISVSVPFNKENDFVSWENLTEEIVISWIESSIDVEGIKQSMESIIDQSVALNTQTNMPWSS